MLFGLLAFGYCSGMEKEQPQQLQLQEQASVEKKEDTSVGRGAREYSLIPSMSAELMVNDKKEMKAEDVIDFLELCAENDIEIIIDGGWGVDALLGKQTRLHGDLDIALQHKYVLLLRQLLQAKGYKDIPGDDTKEFNFVMGDNRGHEIDFHSYTFDNQGNNIFGIKYPRESLTGIGKINGYSVKCISPEWMVKFHMGYKFDEDDYRDVLALCQHFNIPMPSDYEKFRKDKQ
jgi:lincosamide nucleotidyltransferase A/C/D/E